MKQIKGFRGLNIRKGMELDVPVEDIFKIEMESDGDVLAMQLFTRDVTDISELNKKELDKIKNNKEEEVVYYTKGEMFNLSDSLIAHVREIYIAGLNYDESEDYDDDDDEPDYPKKESCILETEKFHEIIFVNTKNLSFFEFQKNIMVAQEFSGKYEKNDFKFSFIGIGDFYFTDYATINDIVLCSKVELLDFFIFDNKILTSIGDILTANYEKDIKEQKDYLTTEEYNTAIKIFKKHKSIIKKELEKFFIGLGN